MHTIFQSHCWCYHELTHEMFKVVTRKEQSVFWEVVVTFIYPIAIDRHIRLCGQSLGHNTKLKRPGLNRQPNDYNADRVKNVCIEMLILLGRSLYGLFEDCRFLMHNAWLL